MDNLELFAVVLGDSSPSKQMFGVEAPRTISVDKFKKLVHAERPKTFARFDAGDLVLWKLNNPIQDTQVDEKVAAFSADQKLSAFAETMLPTRKLSYYFPSIPPEDSLHIIVHIPATTTPPPDHPAILPLAHTLPKLPTEFDCMINDFLNKCRPRMRELVEKAHHVPSFLPSWQPGYSVDENLAKHISELCIPMVLGGRPSLLLHDLGEEKSDLDTDRIALIPNIFSFAFHTILINTSGSGKTRLLLEGLCRRWGFYVVAKPDMDGIGSWDLWQVMEELDDAKDYQRAKTMKKDGMEVEAATKHMREVAGRRLAQLLLARFLLLNLLVEEARQLPGGLREKEHRRLWVFLQAYPKLFGGAFDLDIFADLTRLLRETTTPDLKDRIRAQYRAISELRQEVYNPAMGKDATSPFFCVLDEVQITVTERLGEFMSGDNLTKRPILREIWLLWTTVLDFTQMRLVLSGTGIELQALKETLLSSALKEQSYQTKSDVGAFEHPGIQAEYIKRYVLAHWSDPHWKQFLTRAWAWLRGRHRSTATLISLILQAGHHYPHRIIDEYVEAFTDFRPTDGTEWTDREPQLPLHFKVKDLINYLNFEKMNDSQASTLCDAIYDQTLYGQFNLSSFTNKERDAFVEYGFARHKPGTNFTVIDEPLAILAALQWLYHNRTFSMFKCLQRDIHKHQKRKNGFEAYLAFYVRTVFEEAPRLDTVFTFRHDFSGRDKPDLAWQYENFELVTVVDANSTDPHVSVVTPSCGPAHNVGFSPGKGEEVLKWISTNNDRYAFCFPPESFGPDILFFVRSKLSGRLLLVMVQAKKFAVVDKQTLIHGIRSVTPSWLWKSKDRKHPTADAAPFITNDQNDCAELAPRTKDILADIPLGLKLEDAEYPVLRLVASWPGEAKLERSRKEEQKPTRNRINTRSGRVTRELSVENVDDPDPHPLATLHLANFNKNTSELGHKWWRGDTEQKLVVHLKRVREEEDSEVPRLEKRAKLGTSTSS